MLPISVRIMCIVFFKNGKKIVFGPIKEGSVPKASKVDGKPSLLIVNNKDEFDKECKELKQVYAVVVTDGEPKKVAKIREAIQPLIKEFKEFFFSRRATCKFTTNVRHPTLH